MDEIIPNNLYINNFKNEEILNDKISEIPKLNEAIIDEIPKLNINEKIKQLNLKYEIEEIIDEIPKLNINEEIKKLNLKYEIEEIIDEIPKLNEEILNDEISKIPKLNNEIEEIPKFNEEILNDEILNISDDDSEFSDDESEIFEENVYIEKNDEIIINDEEEIWKKHPIYNLHEGSNYGRVRNTLTGKFLKGSTNKGGYSCFDFSYYAEKVKYKSKHIFIYECFYGIVDSKIYQIHHLDNNPINSNLNNLQKLTITEHGQITHSGKKKISPSKLKIAIWKIKIENNIEVERIKYDSAEDLVKFGFYRSYVIECCKRKLSEYRGYKFEYVDIPDLPNEYWASLYDEKFNKCQVSNLGRIKRRNYVGYGNYDINGYLKTKIKEKYYMVHYLICLAFYGKPPTPEHTPDHLNRDPSNNTIENLRWASRVEQSTNSSNVKKIQAFDAITGKLYKIWDSQVSAAKELNIFPESIFRVLSGKRKKANGYIWRYYDENNIIHSIEIPKINKIQAYNKYTGE